MDYTYLSPKAYSLLEQAASNSDDTSQLALGMTGLALGAGAGYGVSQVAPSLIEEGLKRYGDFAFPTTKNVFYSGDRVKGTIEPGGAVHFTVDNAFDSHGSKVPYRELISLDKAWGQEMTSPNNQKLFYARPSTDDGLGATREKMYARRGFVKGANPLLGDAMVLDNRPLASNPVAQKAYSLLDNHLQARHKSPETFNATNKRIGTIGAVTAALVAGLGGMEVMDNMM